MSCTAPCSDISGSRYAYTARCYYGPAFGSLQRPWRCPFLSLPFTPGGGGRSLTAPRSSQNDALNQAKEDRPASTVQPLVASGAASTTRAVLLAGFTREEGRRIRRWFEEMEPGFRVAPVSPQSLSSEMLGEALETSLRFLARSPHSWLYSPRDTPPAAFLCGLSGEEMVGVVEHWETHAALPRPLFAQLTPEAARRPLGQLLAEMVRAAPRAEASGTGSGREAAGNWGAEPEMADWGEDPRAVGAGEEPGVPELSDAERARAWASIKQDIHRRTSRGLRRHLPGRSA